LAQKGLRRTDENRRYVEMLGEDAYNMLSYYERWTAALARQMIDKGVLTQDEIDAKGGGSPQAAGAGCRLRWATIAPRRSLCACGRIFRRAISARRSMCAARRASSWKNFGSFPNPELLALGRDGLPKKTLYEIAFKQCELWPDYNGPESDTLLIDIYEHWLAKV